MAADERDGSSLRYGNLNPTPPAPPMPNLSAPRPNLSEEREERPRHLGVEAPLASPTLHGGFVFGPELAQALQASDRSFSIVDYCSVSMEGCCEWFFMSDAFIDAHGWKRGITSEEVAEGTSVAFKKVLLSFKDEVQVNLCTKVSKLPSRFGTLKMIASPINYRPSPSAVARVYALLFVEKVGDAALAMGHEEVRKERASLCFTYSSDIISLLTPSGAPLVQNTSAEHYFAERGMDEDVATKRGGMEWPDDSLIPKIFGADAEAEAEFRANVVVGRGMMERRVQMPCGQWYRVRATSSFDPSTSEQAIIMNQRDVTDLQRLEQLQLESKLKEEDDERKDLLFANVSHELKTPLNGIIALAGHLESVLKDALHEDKDKRKPLPASALSNIRVVRTSGQRLANMVTNLLDASLLHRKELHVRPDDCIDLHDLVSSIVTLSRGLLSQNQEKDDVKLFSSVPEGFARFLGDEERLAQTIQNLVSNAIKFTYLGSIEIKASIDREHTLVRIDVVDTGIGIPADKQELVFESLRQVDESATRSAGGTGLGLAIARDLCRAMGGDLTLKSRHGVGSTFSISLPFVPPRKKSIARLYSNGTAPQRHLQKRSSSSRSRESTSSLSLSPNDSGTFSPRTTEIDTPTCPHVLLASSFEVTGKVEILSVDDEPANQAVVEALLSERDFLVSQAANGKEALDLLEERAARNSHLPDLIMLDVMMPVMNGFEACAKIRRLFPVSALPIVMVSAKSREENIIQGLTCGANDYVTKPFSKYELLARIDTQLRLRRAWAVEIEREKSETLLRQMLPSHIIERLKEPGRDGVISEEHERVVVLFSDIVGFTALASEVPTMEIMAILDDLFSLFDDLTDKHDVYKVETIGDAYMVCAGHEPGDDHRDPIQRMLDFARDMLQATTSLMLESPRLEHSDGRRSSGLQIRVGIHCGPAHSGVVGTKMPRYCFFGDTVNTASRMESTSVPMQVQVSQDIVDAVMECCPDVSPANTFVPLPVKRKIKGKGRMQTYFLLVGDGEKTRAAVQDKSTILSEDGSGDITADTVTSNFYSSDGVALETYHRVAARTGKMQRRQSVIDLKDKLEQEQRDKDQRAEIERLKVELERTKAELIAAREASAQLASGSSKTPTVTPVSRQINAFSWSSPQEGRNGSRVALESPQSATSAAASSKGRSRHASLYDQPPEQWDDWDVHWWLSGTMPLISGTFSRAFADCGINGERLLSISEDDLKSLQADPESVIGRMQRLRLLQEIAKLRSASVGCTVSSQFLAPLSPIAQ